MRSILRRLDVALVVALTATACATGTQSGGGTRTEPSTGVLTPAAQARADSGRPPYVDADVRFMQGMIHHHAQAIAMSRLAPSRGASPPVRVLAQRIDVAQRDEIGLMQTWLRERRLPVPDVEHAMAGHHMPGAQPDSLMPGMLTPEQMTQLERATGPEFDRLFLVFMIQHHEGALTMAHDLFSTQGAAQDTFVWQFASDVEADQSSEISRMQAMLKTFSDGRR